VQQTQANKELARVTWGRDSPLVDKGWVTPQQGSIDVQTLKAQEAAVGVAEANAAAQRAQIQVLTQQKAYQRVVAPFDGVITQRNVDVGALVQADAVSGTFMFTIMQSNVIRTQVYVPQDQAFGLAPGVDAVVHVPEIPDRTFPGKVTRIADALQPGTRTLLTEVDIPNPDSWNLLHHRTPHPAQDPQYPGAGRCDHFQRRGTAGRHCRGRGRSHPESVGGTRFGERDRGAGRRQAGRSGHPQPSGRLGRRQEGAHSPE
jgi:hypothetical protein